MTTSKWEELGQNEDSNSQDTSMDSRWDFFRDNDVVS